MYFLKTVIAVVTIFLLTYSVSADAKFFNSQSFALENGLNVIVIPNHRAPVVTHVIWYKVGGADEPKGKSGITHFLEHLMFKGTEAFPGGIFSANVRKFGGNDNAFTSHDYTAYYQNVPKRYLGKMMEMEADRMENLSLTAEDVDRERQVVLEERKQRIDNSPQALFQERLMDAIYMNHPYGTPVIGWDTEIKQLTREDALTSYTKWYAPNNAILIISGDVTVDEVKTLVQKYYGTINPSEDIPAKRYRAEAVPLVAEHRLIMQDDQVGQPILRKIFRAPRADKALEVAADILGGSTTSRLYRNLVMKHKKAISISVNYDPVQLNDTVLTINAIPTPNTNIKDLELAINKELRDFVAKGVTPEEVNHSKNKMLAELVYYVDSLQGPAIFFGTHIASGFKLSYIENMDEQIKNINIESVNQSIKKNFVNAFSVTGVLLPKEKKSGIIGGDDE